MANSMIVFNQIGECQFKECKNIKELEIDNKYKVEKFKKVKTKFRPSILCHLEEHKVHLPKRFADKLDEKIIKDINKNSNLRLMYTGLKDETFVIVELKI